MRATTAVALVCLLGFASSSFAFAPTSPGLRRAGQSTLACKGRAHSACITSSRQVGLRGHDLCTFLPHAARTQSGRGSKRAQLAPRARTPRVGNANHYIFMWPCQPASMPSTCAIPSLNEVGGVVGARVGALLPLMRRIFSPGEKCVILKELWCTVALQGVLRTTMSSTFDERASETPMPS